MTTTPTLLSPEATGGDTAEGGFKFQDHYILARIPAWLASDAFTRMLREGMGDAEAAFFVPEAGMRRELVEYKNHNLTPSEFWQEIERFRTLDTAHPGCYLRFVLCCTSVSDSLRPPLKDLQRMRSTLPFFDGVSTVQQSAYAEFVAAVEKLEKDADMARFLFEKVLVETDVIKTEDNSFGVFRASLEKHFPQFASLASKHARDAWMELTALVGASKAKSIERQELSEIIFSKLDSSVRPKDIIRLQTGARTAGSWEITTELNFPWKQFAGDDKRIYPPAEDWNRILVAELLATRNWLVDTKRSRRLQLMGQRRLSAGVALGAIFSAVQGFAIDMNYRNETWSTDAHPSTGTPEYSWTVTDPTNAVAADVAVAIGIGRDPVPEVVAYLKANGRELPLLTLYGGEALTSPNHTNVAVRAAKDSVSKTLAATGAKTIHLFLAVPAHFALFLGHRLNGTASIQCYERTATNEYQPTCCLPVA